MTTVRKRNVDKTATNKKESDKSDNQTQEKHSIVSWRKLISRFFLAMAIFGFIYFTSTRNRSNDIIFAGQGETLERRSHRVQCSSDYDNEIKFQGCLPKICGRVVTDTLITHSEATKLLEIAKKGLSLDASEGGASILDLHSGALSSGRDFVNIYALADGSKVFSEKDFELYRKVKQKIHQRISMEFGAMPNELYLTHPTFFSKITSKSAKTIHDEYWHVHVDKETYPSFHYTSLLYLVDYRKDFTGGEFVFVDKNINATVEPKLGRLSMFTSGSENRHYVEKVTSGERYALTISFTCNKQFAINIVGPK